jgi:hypothetical protein
MSDTLWNHDAPIAGLVDIPTFINNNLTGSDVAAINQGGCASGAYMPAVTYHQARETMNEHGDDVLQFIEDHLGGGLYAPPQGSSWSGHAVHYVSLAVELWASGIEDELIDAINALEDDDAEEV